MGLIPTESLDQCEVIESEIMKGGKLSKFLKGYECNAFLACCKQIVNRQILLACRAVK